MSDRTQEVPVQPIRSMIHVMAPGELATEGISAEVAIRARIMYCEVERDESTDDHDRYLVVTGQLKAYRDALAIIEDRRKSA